MENTDEEIKEVAEGEENSNPQENIDYKKRYSDSTREFQKVNTVYKELTKVVKNNDYLLELAETNKEVAEKVALDLGYSLDEAIEKLKPSTKKEETFNKEELYKEWEQKQEEKKAKEFISGFIEKVPQEIKDKVENYFNKIAGKKPLSKNEAEEYMDIAYNYVIKKHSSEEAKTKVDYFSGLSGINTGSKSDNKKFSKEAENLAKSLGFNFK